MGALTAGKVMQMVVPRAGILHAPLTPWQPDVRLPAAMKRNGLVVQKDGTLKVPRPLLKAAGLAPGIGVLIRVGQHALVIEQAPRPLLPQEMKKLARLRGCFKHIDWDAVRHDVRERWSAWRERPSA